MRRAPGQAGGAHKPRVVETGEGKRENLDETGSRRLAHSVCHQLEDMIFSGRLRGGDVLTERMLADACDGSRTPLRDALLMLEADGLLHRRSPRHLEVSEMSVQEFMQILNIRRLLEPEAARLCVGRADSDVLAGLRRRLSALLADKAHLQPGEAASIDNAVHQVIADSSGNPLMAGMIRDLRRRTRIFNLGRMPERAEAVYQEHLDIVVAVEVGDGYAAAEAMIRHIDNVKSAVLRHIATV